MQRLVTLAAICVLWPALSMAQISVTAPATQISVAAADDFATRAFQDPWDMSERTDFGWWLFSGDAPATNLTNVTFANGIFSATTTTNQPSLFLLETEVPNSTSVGRKNGGNFPINANAYTHLVFRMKVNNGLLDPGGGVSALGRLIWSPTNIYNGETVAASIVLTKDWFIYDVNIPALSPGIVAGPNVPWGGVIRSLRWNPTQLSGETIQIDWIRLVQNNPSLYQNITWTGSSSVDIYLDNNSNPGDGTLGRIAAGAGGSSYSFFVGSLPAGDYYAVVVPVNTAVSASSARSAGFFRVNDIPRLTFTAPSNEGSNDDFATVKLANPWDFNSMSDIDLKVGIQPGDAIGPLQLENQSGTSSTPQNVYTAISEPGSAISGGFGDPQLYMLFWDFKGKTVRIDPNRYRIFTTELGIPNLARNLVEGSVVRLLWRVAGEPKRNTGGLPSVNTSAAFILDHKAGSNVLSKISFDMKALPLDPDTDATTGWNALPDPDNLPGIDAFRLDTHEFTNPTQFYVKRIKLAALEKTLNGQYTFRWTYSKPSGSVSLYRDSGTGRVFDPATSTLIASGLNAAAGSYTWGTLGTPDGTYEIWADFGDGTNPNRVYARFPLVVDNTSGSLPTIVLNRSVLNFGIVGATRTSSQIVRINFSGAGSQCWAAASNNPGVSVTPTAGNGPASITVSATGNFGLGTTNAIVSVSSCSSSSNAAAVAVAVRAVASSTVPAGVMDSPVNGSAATGSVAVSGWTVDDIQISRVTVCRDPVSGEAAPPNGSCGNQAKIFIGDGVLIDDARPDIEALSPTSPFQYRAGWGYLMLTNFLPNQGNGAFTIHAFAIDKEGQTVQIGSRSIVGQNAAATRPFGAIDTPGQGETICGTQYVNFGWVLTQPPKTIPADSSTIDVYIDNVRVGRPGPRAARSDITAAFPGYNTSNAVGGFVFDTTAYANGVHTIFWIVSDSAGNSDGIGSRFFTIANPCTGS